MLQTGTIEFALPNTPYQGPDVNGPLFYFTADPANETLVYYGERGGTQADAQPLSADKTLICGVSNLKKVTFYSVTAQNTLKWAKVRE
ncbi:MAG: hypothetical protein GY928_34060 [Colwellia sp.]|nr:hypothetical protein [Colwellia sp.]